MKNNEKIEGIKDTIKLLNEENRKKKREIQENKYVGLIEEKKELLEKE